MTATTLNGVMLTGNHASRPSASAVAKGTLYSCTTHSLIYQSDASSWSTWATLGTAASGSITASGYTQNTARLLGRTTASSGAIEEITVGTGLSLSAGSLTATGGAGAVDPIQELFGTPDDAHEFDSSTIGGTAVGSATTMDADTSVPGHLFIKKAATASIAVTGNVWSASAPFTAICKVDGSTPGQLNFVRYGMLGITTSSPTTGKLECIEMFYNSGPLFGGVTYTSPTGTTGAIGTNISEQKNNAPFYLAVVATTTSNIAYYVSHGGWLWYRHTTGRDPSMTIANVGLFIQPQQTTYDATVAYDFLRIWNSAKTFPF